MNFKFFFLGLFCFSSVAMAHHKIVCTGSDQYGDLDWETTIRVYGQRALISHRLNDEPTVATEVKIVDGRVSIPSPDGAMEAFLFVARGSAKLELYDSHSRARLQNPGYVDDFSCKRKRK